MEKFLKQLEYVTFNTRKTTKDGLSGNYRSNKLGNSYDFYGLRQYVNGDDIRNIDWKAFGRTEKTYIREFVEQKRLSVNIFLDNSASMDFGEPNKWNEAKMYALGLSYILLKESNKLNIYTSGDKINKRVNGFVGKNKFYDLLNIVEALTPEGINNYENINSCVQNGQISFIISDLLYAGTQENAVTSSIESILNVLLEKNNQVIVIHTMCKQELNPECIGELKLIDKETGLQKRISIDNKIKMLYKNKVDRFIKNCKKQCEVKNIKYVFACTEDSPIEIILKALEVE